MSWNGVKKQTNIEDIKAWCEEMGIQDYTINSKGEIDVNDCVEFKYRSHNDFKELPYKFGMINGFFSLDKCKNLISLKNCPNYIKFSFAITTVNITTYFLGIYFRESKYLLLLQSKKSHKISGQFLSEIKSQLFTLK